jgi:DNA-binding NtrC family response regulator
LLKPVLGERLLYGGTIMSARVRTVLVVDDEPEIRKLVAAMLIRQGYRILTADSGENAIRLFRNNPGVDLLLTDVVSPGLSGPMIADQIAALNPLIKVMFMSGYDNTQVVQRYVVEKGYSLLIKPFTMEQLVERVRQVLEESRTSSAAR